MALPLVQLHGSPYDQGLHQGQVLRDRIAHNLWIYFSRFERELHLSRTETLRRAARYADAIADQNRDYYDAMRGTAVGAAVELEAIVVLNVRYELFYDEYVERPMADGCTAFALLPEQTDTGRLLIGENWDWIVGVQGAILHTTEANGLATLSFTEAGIIGGKIGLNSAGMGLVINGLTSGEDDWSRLEKPFHVRCYEILRSTQIEAAVNVVTEGKRSCSANYLIAQIPDQVVNIETTPTISNRSFPHNGFLVHSNHFVNPDALGIHERSIEINRHSYWRYERLGALLEAAQPTSLAQIQAGLRDHQHHPYSICFHPDQAEPPEQHYASLVSAVIDLHERTLEISDGPPCSAPYIRYQL
jgi:isopenicillin-N N-acyltransferase-like protein